MPVSQWMEWMEWVSIRGPIGGPRQDFYASFVARFAGRPYASTDEADYENFMMPWLRNPGMPMAGFITPWVQPPTEDDKD